MTLCVVNHVLGGGGSISEGEAAGRTMMCSADDLGKFIVP